MFNEQQASLLWNANIEFVKAGRALYLFSCEQHQGRKWPRTAKEVKVLS